MAKKETTQTIQELTVINPELKTSFLKFEVVKAQLETIAKSCLTIKVIDDASLSVCEQNLTKVSDLCKAVEATRVAEKAPYLDKGKAIDEAAKYVVSLPLSAVSHLKSEKLAWVLKLEAEKKRKDDLQTNIDKLTNWWSVKVEDADSMDKLDMMESTLSKLKGAEYYFERNEEVQILKNNYLEVIKLMQTNLTTLENATPDEAEAIKESLEEAKQVIQETISESKIQQEVSTASFSLSMPKKLRRPWKHELIDINKVPIEWLMLDEDKVKEFLKNNSDNLVDGQVINGIKYYKDLTVTA